MKNLLRWKLLRWKIINFIYVFLLFCWVWLYLLYILISLFFNCAMQENFQGYITSDLQYSSSRLFFQHQDQLLQEIWFISPMSIDIYFKYSFQEIKSYYFIEWWEFEWLTADHDVLEQWIIYKVWFAYPKFQNIKNLSLDLKKNYFEGASIWRLLLWFFWWWVVFCFLIWLSSKFKFWQVLFWLNVIWAVILLIFYFWKFWKILFNKFVKSKNGKYWGFRVNYSDQTDALMLSWEIIWVLDKLRNEFWITKLSYTWNCVYLLQDIHDHEWNRLKSSSKIYSEQEKAALQMRTLEYLRQSEFLSQFILN